MEKTKEKNQATFWKITALALAIALAIVLIRGIVSQRCAAPAVPSDNTDPLSLWTESAPLKKN